MQFAGCLMILKQAVLKSRESPYFERFFGLIPRFSRKSEVDMKEVARWGDTLYNVYECLGVGVIPTNGYSP
jgi:hypothetical protein